jgi:hypothetical protein
MTGKPSKIEDYALALDAARISDGSRLGDQTRDADWSGEECMAAVLSREVSGGATGSGPRGSRP